LQVPLKQKAHKKLPAFLQAIAFSIHRASALITPGPLQKPAKL